MPFPLFPSDAIWLFKRLTSDIFFFSIFSLKKTPSKRTTKFRWIFVCNSNTLFFLHLLTLLDQKCRWYAVMAKVPGKIVGGKTTHPFLANETHAKIWKGHRPLTSPPLPFPREPLPRCPSLSPPISRGKSALFQEATLQKFEMHPKQVQTGTNFVDGQTNGRTDKVICRDHFAPTNIESMFI